MLPSKMKRKREDKKGKQNGKDKQEKEEIVEVPSDYESDQVKILFYKTSNMCFYLQSRVLLL